MSELCDIKLENNNFNEFDVTVLDGGHLSISSSAAMVGSNYGMLCTIADTNSMYGQKNFSSTTGVVHARIHWNLNGYIPGESSNEWIFWLRNATSTIGGLELSRGGSYYYLKVFVYDEGGSIRRSNSYTLEGLTVPHVIEIAVIRGTNGVADGYGEFWVDGNYQGATVNCINYNKFNILSSIRVGYYFVNGIGSTGSWYIDNITVRDDNSIIGPAVCQEGLELTSKNYIGTIELSSINEDIILSTAISVTQYLPGPKYDGSTISSLYNISIYDQIIIGEGISLSRFGTQGSGDLTRIPVDTTLTKFKGITSLSEFQIEEIIIALRKEGIAISDNLNANEIFALEKFLGTSVINNLTIYDVMELSKLTGITVSEGISTFGSPIGLLFLVTKGGGNISIEEAANLAEYLGIIETTQLQAQDITTTLAKYLGITETTQLQTQDITTTIAKYLGITETTQLQAQDITTSFGKYLGHVVNDEILANESISLTKFLGNSITDISTIYDIIQLSKFTGITVSEILTTFGSPAGLLFLITRAGAVSAFEEVINLTKYLGLIETTQLQAQEVLANLVKHLGIIETSQLDIQEVANTLNKYLGIGVEDLIGGFYEGIDLNKFISTSLLDIVNIQNALLLIKSISIDLNTQTNENDLIIVDSYYDLTVTESVEHVGEISETIILSKLIEYTIGSQNLANENVNTNKILNINGITQSLVNENLGITKLIGSSTIENILVGENVTTNKLIGINTIGQILVSVTATVNKLIGLTNTTQCNLNDNFLLAKFNQIIAIDETIGQYSEILTLNRTIGLAILQQGISHVSESLIFTRSNLINIFEEPKLYNTILLAKSDGISIFEQGRLYNSLIFTKTSGLSISVQKNVIENITVNKFNRLNINTQAIVNEIMDLSKLYGLSIHDSRYLLESINLDYNHELLSNDGLTILENIYLRKANLINIVTLLLGFNNIEFGRIESIIAEPPSLYVYSDGDHSVGILFRDKRAFVRWRDKRSGK